MAFLKRFFSGVTQNDVPFYGDVGLDASDLFTDDLDHQKVKVKLTSKTQDPIEFKATGDHNRETQQTGGSVEIKYKHCSNMTYSETWDLENNTSARIEYEHKVRDRPLKLDVGLGLYPIHENNFGVDGTVKYSHRNASFACTGKYKNNAIISNHSVMFGTSGAFIGGRFDVNVCNKEVEGKEITLGLSGKSHQLTVAMVDNMDKMKCSLFNEVNPSLRFAVKGQYVFSENLTSLSAAFKYALNDISTIRGTLNNCGLLGLSFRHAIKPSVALVFNSEFDMRNFQTGNHKSGLSIELTP